jgi:hypothetical protein
MGWHVPPQENCFRAKTSLIAMSATAHGRRRRCDRSAVLLEGGARRLPPSRAPLALRAAAPAASRGGLCQGRGGGDGRAPNRSPSRRGRRPKVLRRRPRPRRRRVRDHFHRAVERGAPRRARGAAAAAVPGLRRRARSLARERRRAGGGGGVPPGRRRRLRRRRRRGQGPRPPQAGASGRGRRQGHARLQARCCVNREAERGSQV